MRLVPLGKATCHLDPAAEARAGRMSAARPGGTPMCRRAPDRLDSPAACW
ncbi:MULTISPECIES: hypothetical protein [unclassified Streptomyces]|nr:hypothetical protein [Streptomyces sp. NBC_01750]WSB03082.1 hypothetical protein OIE54_29735 [Streptomyces sp. NBC_01794]WSD32672.1 hypothetical protein OG966_12530 [Streptomyces sp. NBC_01750]